jgi:nicotinamidase/pyrazinamidase
LPELSDTALVLVDVQNDFCPGGALAVPDGDRVIPALNRAIERFSRAGRPVVASRDWHPAETTHFRSGGGPWPPHCVRDQPGAAFHPALRLPRDATVVSKGTGPREDAYSAFQARDERGQLLTDLLRRRGVRRLVVGGLATDYCVRATVLDALRQGFEVTVLEDGVRGVDLQPGDSERALAEMRDAGARFKKSE